MAVQKPKATTKPAPAKPVTKPVAKPAAKTTTKPVAKKSTTKAPVKAPTKKPATKPAAKKTTTKQNTVQSTKQLDKVNEIGAVAKALSKVSVAGRSVKKVDTPKATAKPATRKPAAVKPQLVEIDGRMVQITKCESNTETNSTHAFLVNNMARQETHLVVVKGYSSFDVPTILGGVIDHLKVERNTCCITQKFGDVSVTYDFH